MLSKIFSGKSFSPLLLLSLITIINTVRNKFFFFPPAITGVIIFSLSVFVTGFITYRLLLFLIKERNKVIALSCVILIIIFFYYDIFYLLFEIKFINDFVYITAHQKFHFFLILLLSIIILLVFFYLRKTKRKLTTFNLFLKVFFILLLLFEISKIFFGKEFIVKAEKGFTPTDLELLPDSKPDIYYLVFDAYTSSASLKKYWHYDNKELKGFLSEKGFFIAEKSRCNYNSTPFSILSALNMSYLNIQMREDAQRTHISKVFEEVKKNAVAELLANNGYDIVNLSPFDMGKRDAFYTEPYYHKTSLFDRTIFYLVTDKLNLTEEKKLFENLEEVNPEIINRISSLKKNTKPIFCYAHIMLPHEPFFYDENGHKMPDGYALNSENRTGKYLSQLKYTNKIITQLVENINEKSKTKPVIIIQGDHGYRYLEELDYADQLEESETIFNAYLLPDDSLQNLLYDSITPVNSFRIIFNNCFRTSLPLLKDQCYNTEIRNKK